jgi:hypothetical protein
VSGSKVNSKANGQACSGAPARGSSNGSVTTPGTTAISSPGPRRTADGKWPRTPHWQRIVFPPEGRHIGHASPEPDLQRHSPPGPNRQQHPTEAEVDVRVSIGAARPLPWAASWSITAATMQRRAVRIGLNAEAE